jgi:hypothetical protein
VSACCREYNCRRKQPIGIYKGEFSGIVYAATRMRLVADHEDGTGTFAASERHDITPQVRRFLLDNREWVLSVLEGAQESGEAS